MLETAGWQFEIEIFPADWRFPAGAAWVAGWLWSPERRLVTDIRAWIDGRPFLGLWGMPRPHVEARFLQRSGPPYLGFSLLLKPHAGATRFRLEVRDQTGHWRELFQTAITVAPDAPPPPPPPDSAQLFSQLLPALLRQQVRRPQAPLAALADEAVSSALAEPLDSLPNPPFYGALEEPRRDGWLRYGRLSITGWLVHRHQPIKRISALVDPLQETTLMHGLRRDDINHPVFADLPGRETAAFLGHTDLPADTSTPALLKVFAELADGEKHLVYAQRFTPNIISGTDAPLPPLSLRTYARTARALLDSLARHHLAHPGWRPLWPRLTAGWRDYAAEAPAPRTKVRLAPVPPADPTDTAPLGVLVATHNLNFEGAPWFIFELARHLATQPGVRVRIVSPQEGPMRRVFEAAGLPVAVLDLAAVLAAGTATDFRTALAEATAALPWTETDLVIGNTMVTFWAVHAAQAQGKPSLLYVHESASIRRFFGPLVAPALFPVIEAAFRQATRVVFTADASRTVYSGLGQRGNFALLPSWVDVGRVDAFAAAHTPAELRRKHGLDPDAVLVVNIGSVCERKGQHVFIQAVDLLKDELRATYPGRRIQFVMIGARPGLYLEMLREEIIRFGLGEHVVFIGETGEIFDFYRLADVFVCTSFEESFPRVLLESAAFRLPIVTTNVNGIPEMLGPDEAWLTPPGDRYRLAEAIKLALATVVSSDRTRPEAARAAVLRKYHEANSLPLHAALARAAARHRA